MINFDAYRHNPKAAAAFISRTSYCYWCPFIGNCDESDCFNKKRDSYSSIKKTQKCFNLWENYFKNNPEELYCVDNLAKILGYVTDCDKCEVAKLNECDYIDTQDCALELRKWLCNGFTTIHKESRRAESEGDDCEPAVSFNGNFLKRLAQAAKKMEPDKEYTLTEIERLLRDSENA